MKQSSLKINRIHKDKLFRLIFNNKKDLLQLYNAVNGTEYTNEEELIINTLEDAVYMGIKNDLSFIIKGSLNLYEHQSTLNPNMPLRGLLYFSDVIQGFLELEGLDVYSGSLIELPVPRYLIFYNGVESQPDRRELYLSDAFRPKDMDACLECKVIVLNVNLGHNKNLMEKCCRLKEYAIFIDEIRSRQKNGIPLKQAVEEAVNVCIENKVLEDILRKNRGEVLNVILTEYDEERHIANEKKISLEEGRRQMSVLTRTLLKEKRYEELERATYDKEFRSNLLKKLDLI